MDDSFLKSTKQVLEFFQANPKTGLTNEQVTQNLKKYGKNELPEDEKTPLWKLILEQFQDQLVIILLVAAIISFVLAFFEEEKHNGTFVDHNYRISHTLIHLLVFLFRRWTY